MFPRIMALGYLYIYFCQFLEISGNFFFFDKLYTRVQSYHEWWSMQVGLHTKNSIYVGLSAEHFVMSGTNSMNPMTIILLIM